MYEKKLMGYCYVAKHTSDNVPTLILFKECLNQKKKIYQTQIAGIYAAGGTVRTNMLARIKDTGRFTQRPQLWIDPNSFDVLAHREALDAMIDFHLNKLPNYGILPKYIESTKSD